MSRVRRGARLPHRTASAYIPAMPARKPRPNDGKTQSERFIEMARELGCDEDLTKFKEKLAQIARHKPKDEPTPSFRRVSRKT